MFDWLHAVAGRLGTFIVSVPLYVAGPAMVLIGALDSSLLSLPEINDYLVVVRCYKHPRAVFIFPLFAALGSVIGCWLLYTIIRRGGQAILRRRFRAEHIKRVERAYARFGILALVVPALLPPPMPFKVFVFAAGVFEVPVTSFTLAIAIARIVRYFLVGYLAVRYGNQALPYIKSHLLVVVIAAVVFVGACYGLSRLVLRPREKDAKN